MQAKMRNSHANRGKVTALLTQLRRDFVAPQQRTNSEKRNQIEKMASLWLSTFPQRVRTNFAPVLVMRGGLLFYDAALSSFSQPLGLLLPPRPKKTAGSLDIPNLNQAHGYILLDLIANTGRTTILALDLLKIHVDGTELMYAVLFATKESLGHIKKFHPEISILRGFDDFVRGPNGWLNGLDFDAGDLATNSPDLMSRFHM